MARLMINGCYLMIDGCYVHIGPACAQDCYINLIAQGTSEFATPGNLSLTYDTPDNGGVNVSVFLYMYVKTSVAISVDNGFFPDTIIDNGVDGKLYRYFLDSADNLTGEVVNISTTPDDGRVTAMIITTNMIYSDNGFNASGVNVTTLTVTLPSGASAAATVDGAFTVLAQPFGHTVGDDFWTVTTANAVLLGNQEGGGGGGTALSAWYWPDSTSYGVPGTVTWVTQADGFVSRPEIDYLYFTCE